MRLTNVMRNIAFFAFSIVLLTGCGNIYYKKPESGPVAKVRFATTASHLVGRAALTVASYENENCFLGKTGGNMGSLGGIHSDPLGLVPPDLRVAGNTEAMVGYSESSGIRPIERAIPAEKDFVFAIQRISASIGVGVISSSTCLHSSQFMPVAGEQYEVVYSEDSTQCYITINRLSVAPNGTVERLPERTARPTAKKCAGFIVR